MRGIINQKELAAMGEAASSMIREIGSAERIVKNGVSTSLALVLGLNSASAP